MNKRKKLLGFVVASASFLALLTLVSGLQRELRFDDWPRLVPREAPEIEVGTEEEGRETPGAQAPTHAEGPLTASATLGPRLDNSAAARMRIFPATVNDRSIQPRDRPGNGRGPVRTEGQLPLSRVVAPDGDGHTIAVRHAHNAGSGRARGGRPQRSLARPAYRAGRSHSSPTRGHGTDATRPATSVGHSGPAHPAPNRGGNGKAKARGHSGPRGRS